MGPRLQVTVRFDAALKHRVSDELVCWIIHQVGMLIVVLLFSEGLLLGPRQATWYRLAPNQFWRITRLTSRVLELALEG